MRVNPLAPLSPLSGYRQAPISQIGIKPWKEKDVKKFPKKRRMSHTKRNFSTVNRPLTPMPLIQGFSTLAPFKSYYSPFRQEN